MVAQFKPVFQLFEISEMTGIALRCARMCSKMAVLILSLGLHFLCSDCSFLAKPMEKAVRAHPSHLVKFLLLFIFQGTRCFCGNSYGRHRPIDEAECRGDSRTCGGDLKGVCGQHDKSAVYDTSLGDLRNCSRSKI